MLLDEKLNASNRSSIDEILQAGHHLMKLINEILDLTRIEEGNLNINFEDCDISKIITSSVNLLSPHAKQQRIELIYDSNTDGSYIVTVDKLRIEQVIINLLSNAIKYNKENGKVYISIDMIKKNNLEYLSEILV